MHLSTNFLTEKSCKDSDIGVMLLSLATVFSWTTLAESFEHEQGVSE